jgi:hypothetical protein
MGKSSELFIQLKERQIFDNADEHVIYQTLYSEQDCDNSP